MPKLTISDGCKLLIRELLKNTLPDTIGINPDNIFKRVDFPCPFGPNRATTSPEITSKDISSNTLYSPYPPLTFIISKCVSQFFFLKFWGIISNFLII